MIINFAGRKNMEEQLINIFDEAQMRIDIYYQDSEKSCERNYYLQVFLEEENQCSMVTEQNLPQIPNVSITRVNVKITLNRQGKYRRYQCKDLYAIDAVHQQYKYNTIQLLAESLRDNFIQKIVKFQYKSPALQNIPKFFAKIDGGLEQQVTGVFNDQNQCFDLSLSASFDTEKQEVEFFYSQDDELISITEKPITIESHTPRQVKDEIFIVHKRISQLKGMSASCKRIVERDLIGKFERFILGAFSCDANELANNLEFVFKILQELKSKQVDFIAYKTMLFSEGSLVLPILSARSAIISNQTSHMIISSATGSGKTLLAPLYLLEDGENYPITFMTQPNSKLVKCNKQTIIDKVLAHSQNFFVCEVYDLDRVDTGKKVLCICTPHQLMNYLLKDKEKISTFRYILDEFHERRTILDCLFALLKKHVTPPRRNQIIIMSATPNKKFFEILPNCSNIVARSQTNYPVMVQLRKVTKIEQATFIEPLSILKDELHNMYLGQDFGHFLIFQPGPFKCQEFLNRLYTQQYEYFEILSLQGIDQFSYLKTLQLKKNQLYLLPILYNGKSNQLQKDLVTYDGPDLPKNILKVIISTQIGATSITIPNLKIVIDPGIANEKIYKSDSDTISIQEMSISEEARIQRKGRVGRMCPGRVFQIQAFSSTDLIPEILKTNTIQLILEQMKIGFDIFEYNDYLPDPIKSDKLAEFKQYLLSIGAIQEQIQQSKITNYGCLLLQFQCFGPKLAHVILQVKQSDYLKNMSQYVALYIGMIFAISAERDLLKRENIQQQMINPYNEIDSVIKLYFANHDYFQKMAFNNIKVSLDNFASIIFPERVNNEVVEMKPIVSMMNKYFSLNYDFMLHAMQCLKQFHPSYVELRTCKFVSLMKLDSQQGKNSGQRMSYMNSKSELEYVSFEKLCQDKFISGIQQFNKYETKLHVIFFGLQGTSHQMYCDYYYEFDDNEPDMIHYITIDDKRLSCNYLLEIFNHLLIHNTQILEFQKTRENQVLKLICDNIYVYQSPKNMNSIIEQQLIELERFQYQPRYYLRRFADNILLIEYSQETKYAVIQVNLQLVHFYKLCSQNSQLFFDWSNGNIDLAVDGESKQLIFVTKEQYEHLISFQLREQRISTSQNHESISKLKELMPDNMKLFVKDGNTFGFIQQQQQQQFCLSSQQIFTGSALQSLLISQDQTNALYNQEDLIKLLSVQGKSINQLLLLGDTQRRYCINGTDIQQSIFRDGKGKTVLCISEQLVEFVVFCSAKDETFSKQLKQVLSVNHLDCFVWVDDGQKKIQFKVYCFGFQAAQLFIMKYLEIKKADANFEIPDNIYNTDLARQLLAKQDFENRCQMLKLKWYIKNNSYNVSGTYAQILKFKQSEICKYKVVRYKLFSFSEIDQRVRLQNIEIIEHRQGVFIVHSRNLQKVLEIIRNMLQEIYIPKDFQCFGCENNVLSQKYIFVGKECAQLCCNCYSGYLKSIIADTEHGCLPGFLNLAKGQQYSLPQMIALLQEKSFDSSLITSWLNLIETNFKYQIFESFESTCPVHKWQGQIMPQINGKINDGKDPVTGVDVLKDIILPYTCVCTQCKPSTYYCTSCKQWHSWNDHLVDLDNFARCPNCHIVIEKSVGCDKISCRCGKYFCYVCCDIAYATEKECYGLMERNHGNFFTGLKREKMQDPIPEPTIEYILAELETQKITFNVNQQTVTKEQLEYEERLKRLHGMHRPEQPLRQPNFIRQPDFLNDSDDDFDDDRF